MSDILVWLKQQQIILLEVSNAKLNEILSGDQNCLHHIKKILKKENTFLWKRVTINGTLGNNNI